MSDQAQELLAERTREQIRRRREARRPLIPWWTIFPGAILLIPLADLGTGIGLTLGLGCAIHLVNYLHHRRLARALDTGRG